MNISEREIKWHLYVGSPIVSSPLVYNGILVAATYDSWIKDSSFTGKNFLLGIDSNYGTQIWNYEIPDGVFSSPCLVGDDGNKTTWLADYVSADYLNFSISGCEPEPEHSHRLNY